MENNKKQVICGLKRSFLILQLIIDHVKDLLHFLEAAVTVDIHFEHAGLGTDRGKKKRRRNRLGEDIQAKAKQNQPAAPAARGRNTLRARPV